MPSPKSRVNTIVPNMGLSPKQRANTISPPRVGDVKDLKSSIDLRTSPTAAAAVFLGNPDVPGLLEQSGMIPLPLDSMTTENDVFSAEILPSLEILDEDQHAPLDDEAVVGSLDLATWTTTPTTTATEYCKAIQNWFKQDPVVQSYVQATEPDYENSQDDGRTSTRKVWEGTKVNSWFLKDDIDEQWTAGSSLFEAEAAWGTMGAPLGTGWYFRRLFLGREQEGGNPNNRILHSPIAFLRQFPEQEFAEFPMVCGCLDDVLACAGLASVGAFTAWLSVNPPLAPVPVNRTLLVKIRMQEAPVEPGKKPSKAKKLMISMELVHPTDEEQVYLRAEGLFVRPATGGLDLRRFLHFGDVETESSEMVLGKTELDEASRSIVAGFLEEQGKEDEGSVEKQLETMKLRRALSLAQLKDSQSSGNGILVRAPNPETLHAMWLNTHPIFKERPELLYAPADPLPGYEYLSGGALLRFSRRPQRHEKIQAEQKQEKKDEEEEEPGMPCVSGAVHFLPPVEGPSGLAHGGCIYGVFDHLFRQALESLSSLGSPEELQLAHENLIMTVQYKGQVPLNGSYLLDCSVCSTGSKKTPWMLRGSLKSVDGKTLYNSAEAPLSRFCGMPRNSRL